MAKKQVIVISILIALICVLGIVAGVCCVSENQSSVPSPTATLFYSPTPGGTPEGSGTPVITDAPTPHETPTLEPTIEPTQESTPEPTPNNSPVGSTSSNPAYAGKKVISLTFDDGPSGPLTPALLDVLKAKNVRATFFVIGNMIAPNYDDENYSKYSIGKNASNILKRAVEEGHEIGNHTMGHLNLKKQNLDKVLNEINMVNDIVEEITGKRPTLLRPPYGNYNDEILANCGMTIVNWNIDSLDWAHISKSNIKKYATANNISQDEAKAILINELLFTGFEYNGAWHPSVVNSLKHGAILLFHDIHPATKDAIAILLDYLEANNYVALPVTEMIMTEGPAPRPGQVYRSIRSK